MTVKLSDHFTYGRLFRFVIPSIAMVIFTSIYGVVDGFFVSNFAGKTAFAAVNLIIPVLMILGALGFMFGTGGAAITAKLLGERKPEAASRAFSLFVYTTFLLGLLVEVIVQIFLPDIARLLGAEGEMLTDAVLYARITLISMPFFMLQSMFQTFFATAGKPKLGLLVTVIAGCTNMVLDMVFVGFMGMGIAGAAAATVISEICGGVLPMIYFFRKNGSLLRLGKTSFSMKLLLKAASNGSSELMSNISTSIVNMLYNIQLLKYIGENGIAAYGVIMYLSLVFNAMFIGYSIGTAPIISFNYGARNSDELKNIFKKSIKLILCCGLFLLFASAFLGRPLSTIFVGYDEELLDLTVFALRIYSIAFLICGLNIFGSAFFTALNNGLISAGISFLRTLVFQIICVMLLPLIFGVNGIWFSVTIAELCAATVTVMCFIAQRKRYKYI